MFASGRKSHMLKAVKDEFPDSLIRALVQVAQHAVTRVISQILRFPQIRCSGLFVEAVVETTWCKDPIVALGGTLDGGGACCPGSTHSRKQYHNGVMQSLYE